MHDKKGIFTCLGCHEHGNFFYLASLLGTCKIWYDSEAVHNWSRKIVCKEVGQARTVCIKLYIGK